MGKFCRSDTLLIIKVYHNIGTGQKCMLKENGLNGDAVWSVLHQSKPIFVEYANEAAYLEKLVDIPPHLAQGTDIINVATLTPQVEERAQLCINCFDDTFQPKNSIVYPKLGIQLHCD